jgi:homoserine kinase
MRARVPASSANLGPGFDALAVALNLYVQVEIVPADSLQLVTEGEGAGLFDLSNHLAVEIARQVIGHDRLAITVRSEIPLSRGLGSSASLAVAAAAAAGAADPFAVATEVDGHPENAAASFFGGLVAATMVNGTAVSAPLPLSDELAFVVMVPDRTLSTAEARQVLPASLSRADATFNLGRMALLLAGLADPTHLTSAATEDRVHQAARTALFPESVQLLTAFEEAGALASCWSGAGSSLLGIATVESAESVRQGAEAAMREAGVTGRVLALQADHDGLVLGEAAELPRRQ